MITAQDGFNFAFGVFQFVSILVGIGIVLIIACFGVWLLYSSMKVLFKRK